MYEGSVGVCVNGMEGHGDRKDGDIGERSMGEELSGFLEDLFQGSPAGDPRPSTMATCCPPYFLMSIIGVISISLYYVL